MATHALLSNLPIHQSPAKIDRVHQPQQKSRFQTAHFLIANQIVFKGVRVLCKQKPHSRERQIMKIKHQHLTAVSCAIVYDVFLYIRVLKWENMERKNQLHAKLNKVWKNRSQHFSQLTTNNRKANGRSIKYIKAARGERKNSMKNKKLQ